MQNTTAARSKAIISMVLALRKIDAGNDPDDPGLTRRFTPGEHGRTPEIPLSGLRFRAGAGGVKHRV